ncbi:efflux RND transporter periplasmic adaptor subunit [Fimbriimonas ginsengisoli]|uniref:Secretion protein HlyD n=1 Tax=Fimbriimonas ginsengisoli Gsoil 348 TaxID=661478 RepID=A0A068NV09_FIMGI|nr:efflux RND transporter periplasmic adaptor subunit [Fimbriimonas ginsengisoli]AIE86570.1 secretion protein HlyD [Fimbriimonas ginsengisoli Gsoil 348]
MFIAITAGGLMAGCGSAGSSGISDKPEGRPQAVVPPGPAKAARRDIVAYETFDGKLYVPPASEAVVHPPYNAPLEQVYVTVGKKVGKGEVIMKLSIPEADASLSDATATEQQAESAYSNARNTLNDSLRAAQRQLDVARKAERDARANTAPGGDATALQQAEENRRAAEAAVQQAQAEYQQNIQTYKDQLGNARSGRRSAKASARQTEITSPIRGTVVALHAASGQVVGNDKNEVLAEIVNLKDLKVLADLKPEQFGRLKENSPVVIRFADFPDKPFDGWVVSLRTLPQTAGGGVKHQALVGFRNDDGLVKPGAVVQSLGIETGRATNVVAVPVGAVDKDSQDRPVVMVLEGKDWTPHVVEVGASDGTYVEIKSGVKEGDTVRVTAGTKS